MSKVKQSLLVHHAHVWVGRAGVVVRGPGTHAPSNLFLRRARMASSPKFTSWCSDDRSSGSRRIGFWPGGKRRGKEKGRGSFLGRFPEGAYIRHFCSCPIDKALITRLRDVPSRCALHCAHPPVSGRWECFHMLAAVHGAAANAVCKYLFKSLLFLLLGYTPRSGIARLYDNSIFNYFEDHYSLLFV